MVSVKNMFTFYIHLEFVEINSEFTDLFIISYQLKLKLKIYTLSHQAVNLIVSMETELIDLWMQWLFIFESGDGWYIFLDFITKKIAGKTCSSSV